MITKMVDCESEKSVSSSLSALARKKNYGENFRYRENVKSGEREVVAQFGSLLIKSGGLECFYSHFEKCCW